MTSPASDEIVEFKACPFCGSLDGDVMSGKYTECRLCHARGPLGSSVVEALQGWAQRNQAGAAPSDAVIAAPTGRGSLPSNLPSNQQGIGMVATARLTADGTGHIGPAMTHRLCDEIERLGNELAAKDAEWRIQAELKEAAIHEIERLNDRISDTNAVLSQNATEIERLRGALLFLGKAFELEDDQTDSGFTYREALGHSASVRCECGPSLDPLGCEKSSCPRVIAARGASTVGEDQ